MRSAGCDIGDIGDVHKSGADGMAVVSAICGQADPAAATRAFKALITEEAL